MKKGDYGNRRMNQLKAMIGKAKRYWKTQEKERGKRKIAQMKIKSYGREADCEMKGTAKIYIIDMKENAKEKGREKN